MANTIEVKVPDIGDFTDVPVIEVLVKAGDSVEAEQALVTLESDKATMEVPAPQAGNIKSVAVKENDTVSQGSVVVTLEVADPEDAEDADDSKADTGTDATKTKGAAATADDEAADSEGTDSDSEKRPAESAAKQSGGNGKSRTMEVKVPDIGDFTDVPVIEVLVKAGDSVEAEQALVTLESDKATMEVPAPQAGTVKSVAVKENDTVSQGSVVVTLATTGGDAGAEAAEDAPPTKKDGGDEATSQPDSQTKSRAGGRADSQSRMALNAIPSEPIPPPERDSKGETPHASPSVRKYARELGANLHTVSGSGPKGRILREDVQKFVKGALQGGGGVAPAGGGIPPIPAVDFSQFGPVETRPLKRIRKLSAAHLHRAWLNLPHVTQTDDADITELEAFRKSQNEQNKKREDATKLTLLPFILKAVCSAIATYPEFAASLTPDGDSLVIKNYRHLGFAADTENGLLVPVIRDVDKKGVMQLAKETGELAEKARAGKLSPSDMKGGVFSVSSLGGIGGRYFSPIINAPEVAILGVSKAEMQPRWDGQAFQPRLMLPLSLSYDHRVIDGAAAARFVVHLSALLGDLRRLVL